MEGYTGQQYPHSKKLEKDTVAILHIYGARSIFLLFYDDQDTEKIVMVNTNENISTNIYP